MPCSIPCFGHTHRQGRGCECDTQASRDALAPLWQRSGGARIDNGTGLHFNADDEPAEESADKALDTPDSAAGRVIVVAKVALVAIVFAAAIAVEYFHRHN